MDYESLGTDQDDEPRTCRYCAKTILPWGARDLWYAPAEVGKGRAGHCDQATNTMHEHKPAT